MHQSMLNEVDMYRSYIIQSVPEHLITFKIHVN